MKIAFSICIEAREVHWIPDYDFSYLQAYRLTVNSSNLLSGEESPPIVIGNGEWVDVVVTISAPSHSSNRYLISIYRRKDSNTSSTNIFYISGVSYAHFLPRCLTSDSARHLCKQHFNWVFFGGNCWRTCPTIRCFQLTWNRPNLISINCGFKWHQTQLDNSRVVLLYRFFDSDELINCS